MSLILSHHTFLKSFLCGERLLSLGLSEGAWVWLLAGVFIRFNEGGVLFRARFGQGLPLRETKKCIHFPRQGLRQGIARNISHTYHCSLPSQSFHCSCISTLLSILSSD